jgi:hypothetical protein
MGKNSYARRNRLVLRGVVCLGATSKFVYFSTFRLAFVG